MAALPIHTWQRCLSTNGLHKGQSRLAKQSRVAAIDSCGAPTSGSTASKKGSSRARPRPPPPPPPDHSAC
eukprot:70021-Rhodomonas_salina.11